MFVVKQVPVCNFILLIFAYVVLRKVYVHSFIVYVGNSGFSRVFAIFRLRYTIKSIMQFVEF